MMPVVEILGRQDPTQVVKRHARVTGESLEEGTVAAIVRTLAIVLEDPRALGTVDNHDRCSARRQLTNQSLELAIFPTRREGLIARRDFQLTVAPEALRE